MHNYLLLVGVNPDAIIHATGSGGTQAGLILGAALMGVSTRIVGINVSDTEEYFTRKITDDLLRWKARYQANHPTPVDIDSLRIELGIVGCLRARIPRDGRVGKRRPRLAHRRVLRRPNGDGPRRDAPLRSDGRRHFPGLSRDALRGHELRDGRHVSWQHAEGAGRALHDHLQFHTNIPTKSRHPKRRMSANACRETRQALATKHG